MNCLFKKCCLKTTTKESKLVNMFKMLIDAKNKKYAVAQININNMEWIIASLDAAQEMNSPIILGVSEGAAKYMCGYKNVASMVNEIVDFKNITVPVALHLDHGSSIKVAIEAIEAGFSSVMFDGSSQRFEDNLDSTVELLKVAKRNNVSVEVEVGAIGGQEDGKFAQGELADVKECAIMAQLPVSCLAAGIGNIHGLYPKNWKGLNFDQLKKIAASTCDKPLVLHGGTGIPEKQIKEAISFGVSKINVNTECQIAFTAATRKYFESKNDLDVDKKGFDPRKVLKPGTLAIKQVVIDKILMFGSKNKA